MPTHGKTYEKGFIFADRRASAKAFQGSQADSELYTCTLR
ncbi:hypothetical protein Osc1_15740 [Hominimerdicola sp. 21CYCFAH17_S]